ncbi:SPW repeat protein [Antrihabitans sp. YC2-6]|uniref:SPW repeat domain-containing protein n=1 Tax=Antrihabitans sp. YC2-6 TaxID=2799498 RepID=UPI0018F3171A|nr:SPW repeat protein [Antrihabitans sp. YC2-6]MBJ8347998.1 SPW repeat protein [Antrihabitans sp. YC2-6]
MFEESRLQDYLAVVFGAFAALSPIWVDVNSNGRWSLIVLGVLIAAAGLAQIYVTELSLSDYAMGLFGVLLFVSPWVMSYDGFRSAAWTAWVVGVLTVVVAVAALPEINAKLHRGGLATHH